MNILIGVAALVILWIVCGLAVWVWIHHATKGRNASPLDQPGIRRDGDGS